MTRKYLLYSMSAIIFVGFLGVRAKVDEQQFTVPKKKRASSVTLKERIGRRYGDLAKRSSALTTLLAQANYNLVERMEDLLGDECGSDRCLLESHLAQLSDFEKKLNAFEKEAQDLLVFLEKGIGKKGLT